MTEPIDQATKDRIEKEAENYSLGQDNFDGEAGYIAGATVWAERLNQERNKAIDECINYVKTLKNSANPNDYGQAYIYTTYNGVITELESLKDKSHE